MTGMAGAAGTVNALAALVPFDPALPWIARRRWRLLPWQAEKYLATVSVAVYCSCRCMFKLLFDIPPCQK
jgi:hypothetical protein